MPQYISKITLPSGNDYDIKDKSVWGTNNPQTWAQNLIPGSIHMTDVIETLKEQISAITGGDAVVFKGVSSTALTDGGTQNPTIDGSAVTTKTTGDLYFYNKQEFIYGDDGKWHSLGPQLQSLGDLAYKSSSTVKYDKTTGVSSTFSGSNTTFTGAYTPAGTISLSTSNITPAVTKATNGSTTYKPEGMVSRPTFNGALLSSTAAYTPSGTVSQPTFSGAVLSSTAAYKPEGTIINVARWKEAQLFLNCTTFDAGGTVGTQTIPNDFLIKYTPSGTFNQQTFTGETLSSKGVYTPAGTVSTPTISVKTAGTTTTIKNPTKVTVAKTVAVSAPSGTVANEVTYYSVANENLTLYKIGYTTGDSISTSNVTVKTGDAAYQNTAPTFTGTASTVTVSGTPAGTVSKPVFHGFQSTFGAIASYPVSAFTGTASTITAKGTPAGTVSQPTFSGTASTITAKGTPAGTVSEPTFSGTAVRLVTQNIAIPTTATFNGTAATVSVSGTPKGSVTSSPSHTSTNATVTYS